MSPVMHAIPLALITARNLSRDARWLYSILMLYAWRNDTPDHSKLMHDMECSPQQLAKYILELETYGLLEKRESESGKWIYVLKDIEV